MLILLSVPSNLVAPFFFLEDALGLCNLDRSSQSSHPVAAAEALTCFVLKKDRKEVMGEIMGQRSMDLQKTTDVEAHVKELDTYPILMVPLFISFFLFFYMVLLGQTTAVEVWRVEVESNG